MTQTTLGGLPYLLPRVLQADPYGPSPLVTDLSARNPGLFAVASERGPAPTLFASGDLPPFLTSGCDAQLLTRLPYHWRHAAASLQERSTFLAWLEECAQDREQCGRADAQPHRGLDDYRVRMEEWVSGLQVPELSWEDATYPDSFKTPRMRQAERVRQEAS